LKNDGLLYLLPTPKAGSWEMLPDGTLAYRLASVF